MQTKSCSFDQIGEKFLVPKIFLGRNRLLNDEVYSLIRLVGFYLVMLSKVLGILWSRSFIVSGAKKLSANSQNWSVLD